MRSVLWGGRRNDVQLHIHSIAPDRQICMVCGASRESIVAAIPGRRFTIVVPPRMAQRNDRVLASIQKMMAQVYEVPRQ